MIKLVVKLKSLCVKNFFSKRRAYLFFILKTLNQSKDKKNLDKHYNLTWLCWFGFKLESISDNDKAVVGQAKSGPK